MPGGPKRIVPAEGKLLNTATKTETEVGILLKRIEAIQEKCQHVFLLVEPVELAESLVPGVYLSSYKGVYIYKIENMEVYCTQCSLESCFTLLERCPTCLSKMKKGNLYSRKTYEGAELLYYASRLFECTNCEFSFVRDEWESVERF
ncbi:MAG: hypothetical protein G01um101448_410 [Parcubacteria group bacterium Gr01-1014_48]|nr:MAG: hypothetical protein Greene041614_790 [Parcubacteria group bacterium Greene0416_14]TSC73979.1 MAG: hypothetical protein G01um101448_410 [Parcubacteria group bacterium Gr01-1014_48]TSD00450.1 MAG: hypothetical protein Greene101415_840 [Parcubacteria group bacterium Greene1014_15]TSD07876.1 MAG: hypothetical protein Greene07144_644 [Parcubacteria group bacterium Greene0714_4]